MVKSISKKNISVIVSDLGNVLIPFDYTIAKQKLDRHYPGLGEKFMSKYHNNYDIHRSYEAGKISDAEFLKIMMAWTENKVDSETFCRIFSDVFTENTELTSLLPELSKKYRLILLSNTNNIHRIYGWEKYSFLKYFEKLILSYETGFVKPESGIYKVVTDYTGLLPEEHIFIDDIAEYAQGAINCGWDAIQFIGMDNLKEEFKIRGII